MKKYKFKMYSRKYLIRPILFWLIGPFILMIIIYMLKGYSIQTLSSSYLISIFTLIPFFPLLVFIFFFNYKKHNGKSTFSLTDNYKKFNYKDLNSEIIFENSDIKKIFVYFSYPEYEKRTITAFWTEYYYVKIVLKNENNIIITCLLSDEIINYLDRSKIIYKKKFFPLIK
ncbi:hypothetical protein M0M57_07685 [Flavobacterium azooxidireducens]|uniref:PH domain-containing protein n=1 Tax=Flavobacterium azooxidireducens TaxID=1871076 RepID=A0ABY4KK79_9FLAO|nr:hypothetical protein [Flavobacterium azooxidireducens]UPQ80711.1 hypothetical protein M0M57_07685 [Flavobacterium azooxidireducens]